MALIIRTISYKGLPPNQEISGQFDTHGGTLGRAPNNHLVLPDPEKYVSRLHATIVYEAGQYFIEDNSTGGTYINGGNTPLHQARAPLHGGEKIRIGDYELLVTLTDAANNEVTQVDQPVRQLDLAGGDFFAASSTPPKPTEPSEDFFSSFSEQPESSVGHESFIPPQIEQNPPASDSGTDDLDFGDLLSKLDSLPGSVNSSPLQTPDLPDLPDDFFADDIEEKADVLPTEAQKPASQDFPGVAALEPEPAKDDVFTQPDPFAVAESPVFEQKPEAPIVTETPPEVVEQTAAQSVPMPREPIIEQVTPPRVAPAQAPPTEKTPAFPADDRLLREFLAGAGISDPNFIAPEQWPDLMRTSGELLRNMVEGLMRVLRARAELKSQFRVAVTTMRPVDNNPLKFTPNADDAMRLILSPTNPGFLPPQQAVSEGFNDIMNHQIAMTAGIQAALADILRSFDPQLIEKTQGEGLLFQKKAKCWEYYVEKYPKLKAIAQEEFFGEAFADAYEKQMMLLSRSNPKP